jgi:hypothetical protein
MESLAVTSGEGWTLVDSSEDNDDYEIAYNVEREIRDVERMVRAHNWEARLQDFAEEEASPALVAVGALTVCFFATMFVLNVLWLIAH